MNRGVGSRTRASLLHLALSFVLGAQLVHAQAEPVDAVAGTVQTAPERPRLDAILDKVDREMALEVGVHVDLLDGTPLYDFQGDAEMVLASNNKLFTSAAALMALEPEYRWTTRVFGDAEVLRIVGGGDPSLRRIGEVDHAALFLDALAQRLADEGIQAVARLELDARYFEGPERHPGWPSNQWQNVYCAPASALMLEGGCLEITSESGSVRTFPEVTQGVDLRFAKKEGKSLSAWWGRTPSEITVARSQGRRDETVRFAVQEQLPIFSAWAHTGLERRGIQVGEVVVVEPDAPESSGEPLLAWPSFWTLADVLVVVNKQSDNTLAEMVFKTLGREFGTGGSFQGGADAVARILDENQGEGRVLFQGDGSGMARDAQTPLNVSTPQEVCALLRWMAEHPTGPLYFDTLPIAGVEGRLGQRFRDPVFAPQRIHAKTGFIRGASSLSGYLLLPDQRIAVFSFVVNFDPSKNRNTNNRRFKELQEEFLGALIREES